MIEVAIAGPKTVSMMVSGSDPPRFPVGNAHAGHGQRPSHSSSAIGNEDKAPAGVLDGKVNFRVRKKRQSSFGDEELVVKPRASSPPTPNPSPNVAKLAVGEAELSLAEDGRSFPSTVVETVVVKRQSARQRRAAERAQSSEVSSSDVKSEGHAEHSRARSARRVSRTTTVSRRRKAVVAVSAPENLPSSDFLLSLSESTGIPSGTGVVDAARLPILVGKALSAPEDVTAVLEYLKSVDPLLKTVIEANECPKFKECKSTFLSLAQSIVYQQLATNAAAAIFGRLVALCEGLENVKPVTISQLTTQQMRAVGISKNKASYLHDLSANFLSGALSDSSIQNMDDDALMKALTAVKGIGVWSVHMFMLFSLHKPDVLPVGDLGVRKGFQKLYRLKELPTPAQLEKIASSWQPYRSLGSWYMWRVMSNKSPLKEAT